MADRRALTVVLLAPASSLHTQRWAAALTASGHRVIVASWSPGPAVAGTELKVVPAAGTPLAGRLPLALTWLRRLIRQTRPDLIHVHSLGIYGLLALALPGSPPQVITPWGSELGAARRSRTRQAVIRHALNRADLVLPTSAEVRAEVHGRYRVPLQRTGILSWGVAEELFGALAAVRPDDVRSAYGIPRQATVVLSVRSTTATYRIHEVVTAFANAAQTRPDLHLIVLAGHCPQGRSARHARTAYLTRIRASAGTLANRVLIVDRLLSPRQVFELMCAADLAVSIPATDQRSSSVLEAALAGCSLLLSDIPPYQEMVSDGLAATLLAEPVSCTLATALRKARADEHVRTANQAFIRGHEHGPAKVADLERIYLRLRAASAARTH